MRKSLKELMKSGGGLTGFPWPDRVADFDIRIARDGTWYHEGAPIRRMKLVQLFATVLQRDEDGAYWLVTPGERGRIEVEDAPFVAVEMRATGEEETGGDGDPPLLSFRTNLDYWVTADESHPIWVEEDAATGEPSPYIMVRDGLKALIARPVFYDLVDMAEEDAEGRLVVRSGSHRFVLGSPHAATN